MESYPATVLERGDSGGMNADGVVDRFADVMARLPRAPGGTPMAGTLASTSCKHACVSIKILHWKTA